MRLQRLREQAQLVDGALAQDGFVVLQFRNAHATPTSDETISAIRVRIDPSV